MHNSATVLSVRATTSRNQMCRKIYSDSRHGAASWLWLAWVASISYRKYKSHTTLSFFDQPPSHMLQRALLLALGTHTARDPMLKRKKEKNAAWSPPSNNPPKVETLPKTPPIEQSKSSQPPSRSRGSRGCAHQQATSSET